MPVKKVTAKVAKKTANDVEVEQEEGVSEVEVPDAHANITFGSGASVNLGDYNNGRVYVELSMPCDPSEVDEVFDNVKAWVDERVQAEVDELRGD